MRTKSGNKRDCRGLTALVTGASGGLGEQFARRLAGLGADLILVSRSPEALSNLADELGKTFDVRVYPAAFDLSLTGSSETVFEHVRSRGLRVDILVNNAGFGDYGPFESSDPETCRRMVDVNIQAMVGLTRRFLPGMLERRKGGIINIASTAGFQPIPYLSLYAASKAFVIHFTEALWAECKGRHVRVLCLCPGNTRTRFHETAAVPERKIFGLAQADRVVEYGLRVFFGANRPTAVYGLLNRMIALGYRIAPRSWMADITRLLYRP